MFRYLRGAATNEINRQSWGVNAKGVHLATMAALAAILSLAASPSGAQEAGAGAETTSQASGRVAVDTITVTARKREENLQTVPIAITAFTGESLLERGLTNLMEVGSFAPNVNMAAAAGGSGGGTNAQIYIRGIGQTDFLFTTDPGVGIYIDGVYHPRTLGGVMDLLDLERVEVLRGPQGTLFGKNTIGGAINIISSKPTGDTGGYGELVVGKFNRIDGRGSFEFPVVEDKLFAKVSFSSKNRDGNGRRLDFTTGELIDKTGNENEAAGRVALRYVPDENITFDLIGDYSRVREQSVPTVLLNADPLGGAPIALWNALIGGPAGTPFDGRYISGDPDVSFGTGPNNSNLTAWGVNLTAEWDAGPVTIKSITAYREMEALFGRDGDGSPLPIVETNQAQDQNQISQEIQVIGASFDDRLNWVVGGFYFNEFGRDDNDVVLTSGLFGAFEALPGPINGSPLAMPTAPGGPGNPINVALDLDFDVFNEIDITSYAAFTQGTFDVTDKLSLTGGARLTYEKKDYFLNHFKVASMAPIVFMETVNDDWTAVTYEGTADYQLTDDMLVYAKASRGFKSGGFNGRPINDGSVGAYDPEFLFSIEGGLKSDWWDHRLRLNGAVFYYDYKDLQLTSVATDAFGALALIVINGGDAQAWGVEAEIEAQPIEGLDIRGSFGYIDLEYTRLEASAIAGAGIPGLGAALPKAPELTGSLSAQYTVPVQDYGNLSIRGDWTYRSENFPNVQNSQAIKQRAHSIVNARIAFEDPDNGWVLAVFMTNVTNVRFVESGLSAITSFGTEEGFFSRPREWGVSVKKTF
jgi:iron complex outermembrane recepter protein